MKTILVLTIAFALGMTACDSQPKAPDPEEHAPYNRAMIQWLNDAAVDGAIVTQQTLYPYHFVTHSPALNDLGRRDLQVLANHFRRYSGTINVRRADTPEELYEARLDEVRRTIARMGVPAGRIVLDDRMPGGVGELSERVIQIREQTASAGAQGGSSDSPF